MKGRVKREKSCCALKVFDEMLERVALFETNLLTLTIAQEDQGIPNLTIRLKYSSAPGLLSQLQFLQKFSNMCIWFHINPFKLQKC